MEELLSKVTQHAVNYAIRSGVAITSGYAIKQCARLLKEAPRSEEREELVHLQARLETKIKVISPSIDMIELIAARGNTSLESAVSLTKNIRFQLQSLGVRLANAANQEERRRQSRRIYSREDANHEVRGIIAEMNALLARIEDAVPLFNLAITTSGVNLSTKLSGNVSPSRLMQASTFLTMADTSYKARPSKRQQVGPAYKLSVYMLFAGHARPAGANGVRETTWKEVLHKTHLKLWRVPLEELYSLPGDGPCDDYAHTSIPADEKSSEFAYQLVLIEDLDDDRVHTTDSDIPQPGSIDGVLDAGIREVIPVHQISKLFYADTGKILNIGDDTDANHPVLLLKRDVGSEPPRRMMQQTHSFQDLLDGMGQAKVDSVRGLHDSEVEYGNHIAPATKETLNSVRNSHWHLPADLDPGWIALEVYSDEHGSDSEEETPSKAPKSSTSRSGSEEPGFVNKLSQLALNSSPMSSSPSDREKLCTTHVTDVPDMHEVSQGQPIKTSLSLLEMLIKLTAIQQFRQESHLAVEDELLNIFLEERGTACAGADKGRRQRVRHDALHRVGFDPYDESPIKRRGEAYIQRATHAPTFTGHGGSPHAAGLAYDDVYGFTGSAPPDLPAAYKTPSPTSTEHSPSTKGTFPQIERGLTSPFQPLPRSSLHDGGDPVKTQKSRTSMATPNTASTDALHSPKGDPQRSSRLRGDGSDTE